jgi:hypothetical protein
MGHAEMVAGKTGPGFRDRHLVEASTRASPSRTKRKKRRTPVAEPLRSTVPGADHGRDLPARRIVTSLLFHRLLSEPAEPAVIGNSDFLR